jgi:DNA-binding MarR family transcriptional regulator
MYSGTIYFSSFTYSIENGLSQNDLNHFFLHFHQQIVGITNEILYTCNYKYRNNIKMKIEDEIKQKKFKDNWKKALINLHFTSNFLKDKLLTELKEYKINEQHYNILRILKGRYPNAACPGEIKEVLINKRGDLTRLLDKLNILGYIDRSTNAENRRMVNVYITETGIQLLDELLLKVDSLDNIKNKLSNEEAIQLSTLLDKIRN